MNIVFGGSFNPPTKAHEKIVNILLEEFPSSKVIILPVGNKYQKSELLAFELRFEMLSLVFGSNNRVIISKLENTNNFLGTINSLDKLSESYSNLYFVMGTDNLKSLSSWIEYERLIKEYPFIFIERDSDNIISLVNNHPNIKKYYKIKFNEEISSSVIRENVLKNKNMLNEKVLKYIIANKLYEVKSNV